MRRKRTAPTGMSIDELPPQPSIDPGLPYLERRAIVDQWNARLTEWTRRRDAHAERYGWPGGETARLLEEPLAMDEPFDPDYEL